MAARLYTESPLREELADLQIVELLECDAYITEGSGHRGRFALIGLVARRG